jgi:hypothetical protein
LITLIFIGVRWPSEDVSLPFITIINQGEQEAESSTLLGDAASDSYLSTGTNGLMLTQTKAVPLDVVTNVYVGSNDEELTMYLYNIVRYIFLSNKLPLSQLYDIHNLVVNGQPLEYDPEMQPVRAFYRVIQLRYLTMFDWSMSEEAASILSIDTYVTP